MPLVMDDALDGGVGKEMDRSFIIGRPSLERRGTCEGWLKDMTFGLGCPWRVAAAAMTAFVRA